MRSTDPVRVRSVCQSGPRSALRRPWSPSASGVPTTAAERPSQPGRRQISARTQATKSIDSSYLRMLHHLADYAHPSSDFAGLSKDPFLRPSSTRTGRGAYVAYGSFATEMSCPRHVRFTPPIATEWPTSQHVSRVPESDSCSTANSANRVSSDIYHQARQRNFPISSVVVDAFGGQTLAGLNYCHRLHHSNLHQLSNDVLPLSVRI